MSYDYIVVGAGSAGCALASRLSEIADCKVLLIEAGAENTSNKITQPNQWPTLWESKENWGYSTTQQEGYALRTIPCPRGKVLGGTSSLNAMIYIRGNTQDYDHWAELGNRDWGWKEVLPYFVKAEDQQHGASALHGVNGPLKVSDQTAVSPHTHAFVESAVAAGHSRNADFNGASQLGAGLYQVTMKGGRRWSSADAYLGIADTRPNLKILTRARVLRILLDGDRATGIEIFDGATIRKIYAQTEVILSAGTIDSPRLLMLSGIGNANELKALGIKPHLSLPGVGANLCDHPGSAILFKMKEPMQSEQASIYAEGGLFMKSKQTPSRYDSDIQFFANPYSPALPAASGYAQFMGIAAQACRPASRGSVKLRSNDPFDHPLIDPRYLTDAKDLELQMEGVREVRRIAAQEPLRSLILKEAFPGDAVQDDAALTAAIRATSSCIWHPVGTCRMGNGDDAVVDDRLRVRGIRNLRVVDASIMPQIVSGNTNAPTIMIAEKAADFIKNNVA